MAAQDLREALGPKFRGLQSVRVAKADVIAKLQANLEIHKKEFKEAHAAFVAAAIAGFESEAKLAREGKEFRPYVQFERPEDHSSDYENVIVMLSMSLDSEFELSSGEFHQFCLDQWNWKGQLQRVSASYNLR